MLALGRLDICDMAAWCVGRPTQGSGGRLHRVRAADIAEHGGSSDPCRDEDISLALPGGGFEQACPQAIILGGREASFLEDPHPNIPEAIVGLKPLPMDVTSPEMVPERLPAGGLKPT